MLDPAIKAFCDRVILPALLERFRAEQAAVRSSMDKPARVEVSSTQVRA
jgi:hypothetical protein